MSIISQILKDSSYKLALFNPNMLDTLEKSISTTQDKKGKDIYKTVCLIRGTQIVLTPEEVVRQLYLDKLLNEYHYPKDRFKIEYPVQFGGDNSKRADIVIYAKEKDIPYIIIELKKPKQKEGKEQLKSYCNGTGAPMGVWTNGDEIEYYQTKSHDDKHNNAFEPLLNIPTYFQTLKDVLDVRFTILELIAKDKLVNKSLKRIIEEFEDEVLANAGVDVFEEAFKLIFSKLFDEHDKGKDKDKLYYFLENNPKITLEETATLIGLLNIKKEPVPLTSNQVIIKNFYENTYKNFKDLEFRNTGVETDTKKQIDNLFEKAKTKWTGIFQADDQIKLTAAHLQTCASYLQDVKLFNSNLEVVDEAFEYLINKDSKGDKGQYFTPRYVIDMCVKMLHPKAHEYMIDTASGSCGFPVHTIFHVWQQLNPKANAFTTGDKTQEQIDYVRDKIFGIDFDEKAVRVGRTLNLIAGDGETNVLQINSLDYERWDLDFNSHKEWRKKYGKGFENLENLKTAKNSFKEFEFDILMANPPFAGDIKEKRLTQKYELAKKYVTTTDPKTGVKLSREKGWYDKTSRDVLFIERNLDMLKAGGRMAVVLPQGRFNNSSDKNIREFIAERCRILAVIGLHGNTFKPHTGTKTSVIFIQKWTDKDGINPKQEDYPIFFATQQLEGKDNSGEKIYWKKDDTTTKNTLIATPKTHLTITTSAEDALKDANNHPVVYHDFFSTDFVDGTKSPEGIVEAFIQFASKEKLSFF